MAELDRWDDRVFLVAKSRGPSSFAVVRALRRATGVSKAGHAGALDPLGEGLLLICTGKATRAVQFLMDLEKEYEFDLTLGVETSTLDAEGDVVREEECPPIERETIAQCARSFLGGYLQEPPMYSAIKRAGRRLYKLARAGKSADVGVRMVRINGIEVLEVSLPVVTIKVRCSRGMYVRALARDIAAKLGLPGYVSRLVRRSVGGFSLSDAFPDSKLFQGEVGGLEGLEVGEALSFLPGLVLSRAAREALLKGVPPRREAVVETLGDIHGAHSLRLLGEDGELLAVGRRRRQEVGAGAPLVDSYRLFVEGGR